MNKIRIMECFGGIGALTKAFKRTGIPHEVVEYVEIDKYAVASYNAMNGTNFEPQDICEWDKDIEIDFLMHGSPCQDFSLAGLQAGGDEGSGTRSSLMYETIRIVEKLRPKYVVWENVKNLISKKHRHNFDAYLEKMSQLGYTNYWQVLNAKDYGIPQNRERVFTVSILGNTNYEFPKGEKCQNKIQVVGNYMPSGHDASRIVDENGLAPTVKENHGTVTAVLQRFEFPPKQELKLKLKDMLEENVDEKYYLSDDKIEKIAHWKAYQKPFEKVMGDNSIVPTLTARGAGEEHSGMITYSDALRDTSNLQEECLNIKSGAYARDFGSRGKIQNKDYCDTLTSSMGTGGGNVPIIKIKNATKQGYLEATAGDGVDIGGRMQYHRGNVQKDMIQTLTACGNERGVVVGESTPKISNLRIRKLTPKECFRLMGFDDEDYEKAAQVNSNSQLYKQAGNSIVVDVLVAIILNLFPQEDEFDDLD